MKQGPTISLAGKLLLAMPDMPDPHFRRAVIAMCVHDENGALGLALGEVIEGLGLHDLMRSFDIDPVAVEDRAVLLGGPVEPRRGFILHSKDWMGADSVVLGDDLALSASLDVLTALAVGEGPAHFLVVLGYAGWGPGQLESELACPGWFSTQCGPRPLFDVMPDRRWSAAFSLEGIDPAMLSLGSGTA